MHHLPPKIQAIHHESGFAVPNSGHNPSGAHALIPGSGLTGRLMRAAVASMAVLSGVMQHTRTANLLAGSQTNLVGSCIGKSADSRLIRALSCSSQLTMLYFEPTGCIQRPVRFAPLPIVRVLDTLCT